MALILGHTRHWSAPHADTLMANIPLRTDVAVATCGSIDINLARRATAVPILCISVVALLISIQNPITAPRDSTVIATDVSTGDTPSVGLFPERLIHYSVSTAAWWHRRWHNYGRRNYSRAAHPGWILDATAIADGVHIRVYTTTVYLSASARVRLEQRVSHVQRSPVYNRVRPISGAA